MLRRHRRRFITLVAFGSGIDAAAIRWRRGCAATRSAASSCAATCSARPPPTRVALRRQPVAAACSTGSNCCAATRRARPASNWRRPDGARATRWSIYLGIRLAMPFLGAIACCLPAVDAHARGRRHAEADGHGHRRAGLRRFAPVFGLKRAIKRRQHNLRKQLARRARSAGHLRRIGSQPRRRLQPRRARARLRRARIWPTRSASPRSSWASCRIAAKRCRTWQSAPICRRSAASSTPWCRPSATARRSPSRCACSSAEFRDERMLKAEEKAGKLPATLTVPMILFILPALFVVLIGPPSSK